MQLASKEGFYKSNTDGIGMTAITSTGNVWKSYDAGQGWTQITSAVSANSLSAKVSNVIDVIMSSTVQPGYMYAAEGVIGSGSAALTSQVYRSMTGVNWERAGNAILPANTFISAGTNPYGGCYVGQIFETDSRIYVRWNGDWQNEYLNRTAVSYNTGAATLATMTNIISSSSATLGRGLSGLRNFTPSANSDVGVRAITYYAVGSAYFSSILQGGTSNQIYQANPPLQSSFSNVSSSDYVYDRFANTFAAFRNDGVQIVTPAFTPTTSPSPTNGTNFGTAYFNVSTGTYAIPTGSGFIPPATGNYYVAGRSDTGNTFYTWTPGSVSQQSAWTTHTVGSSLAAPHRVCGTNRGQLIYRTGASTNQAWWTTDSCATLTPRNLPETAIWRGVFWNY